MTRTRLKVLLLTEEDQLYLPLAIAYLLDNCRHSIDPVCCLRNPTTAPFRRTVRRFISAFGFSPLVKHGARLAIPIVRDRFPRLNHTDRQFSVRRTVLARRRKYQWIEDVNSDSTLEWIAGLAPDLIVAVSPTQIFGDRLLRIPRFGCLNVHSSSLPRHRGLYPVFWAMATGDEMIGVSVHEIDSGVDTGDVVLHETIPTASFRTMHDALVATKLIGARLLCRAIDQVSDGLVNRTPIDRTQGNYNSFPTQEAYARFRANGFSLW